MICFSKMIFLKIENEIPEGNNNRLFEILRERERDRQTESQAESQRQNGTLRKKGNRKRSSKRKADRKAEKEETKKKHNINGMCRVVDRGFANHPTFITQAKS